MLTGAQPGYFSLWGWPTGCPASQRPRASLFPSFPSFVFVVFYPASFFCGVFFRRLSFPAPFFGVFLCRRLFLSASFLSGVFLFGVFLFLCLSFRCLYLPASFMAGLVYPFAPLHSCPFAPRAIRPLCPFAALHKDHMAQGPKGHWAKGQR